MMVEQSRSGLAAFLTEPPLWAAVIYLPAALLLLPRFNYLMYKDEISYVTIAERYALGDWMTAPNAYWAPLLSWLLACFLRLGISATLAAKLLSLVIAVTTFFTANALAARFSLNRRGKWLLSLLLIPILLYCSLIFFTPDLLLACLLLLYFSVLFDHQYASRRYAGIWAGLLGAFLYFGKGFALPFFLAHFPLTNLILYWVNKNPMARRTVLRHCAAGLLVFAVLGSIWVYLLYKKYGEVTPGMTGKYNHAIVGPLSLGRPTATMGIMPPPPSATVSFWEEPYYFYSLPEMRACCLKPWNLFESRRAFKQQIKLILVNIRRTADANWAFSVLSVFILLASVMLWWHAPPALTPQARLTLGLALFSLALYAAGYLPVYSEERYLWPVLMLILMLGVFLLQLLFQTKLRAKPVWQVLVILLFSAAYLRMPVKELQARSWRGIDQTQIGHLLAGENLRGARFASNTDGGGSTCVSYRAQAKYYGTPKPHAPKDQLVEELRRKGVTHYLVWEAPRVNLADNLPGLEFVKELKSGRRSLKIYTVQAPGSEEMGAPVTVPSM